jgi:hypothetical protein
LGRGQTCRVADWRTIHALFKISLHGRGLNSATVVIFEQQWITGRRSIQTLVQVPPIAGGLPCLGFFARQTRWVTQRRPAQTRLQIALPGSRRHLFNFIRAKYRYVATGKSFKAIQQISIREIGGFAVRLGCTDCTGKKQWQNTKSPPHEFSLSHPWDKLPVLVLSKTELAQIGLTLVIEFPHTPEYTLTLSAKLIATSLGQCVPHFHLTEPEIWE